MVLRPRRAVDPTPALHDRALDDLRFIRQTMEQAAAFTAFSGWGSVAIGLTAVLAAAIAPDPGTPAWFRVWIGEAALALAIGVTATLRKARAAGEPIGTGPAVKFCFSVAPCLAVGTLATAALAGTEQARLLPGLWLLLYGGGLVSGGLFSLRILPAVGVGFMVIGAVALFASPTWGNPALAAGFGGLHVLFGVVVARKYGG
jgi:hypothetical protein